MMRDNEMQRFSKPGNPPLLLFADRNIYLPRRAIVRDIVTENDLVKTYRIAFEDEIFNTDFTYLPGQFMMLSLPHCGEAPISFSSSPSRPGSFSLTIRKAGKLTSACHALKPGDMIGVRGPYGRSFPMEQLQGCDLLFIAGGIGMAPLRSVIEYCIDNRDRYGRIQVLYGCKHPDEFCFQDDLEKWDNAGALSLQQTVDNGTPDWKGRVGLVTALLEDIDISENTQALVCGPGIMIRFVIAGLRKSGLTDEKITTTLERHMKCGVGICGHCHFEDKMICIDGPVFSATQLHNLEAL